MIVTTSNAVEAPSEPELKTSGEVQLDPQLTSEAADTKAAESAEVEDKAVTKEKQAADLDEPDASGDDDGDVDDALDVNDKAPPKWFLKKISKLTKRQHWLEEELIRARNAQVTPPPVKVEEPKEDTGPAPEDFPDSYLDYMAARAKFEAKQEVHRELQQRDVQSQQQAELRTYQERVQQVKAKHPDFEKVLSQVPSDIVPSPELAHVMKVSVVGPEIALELARDVSKLRALIKLPPYLQVMEAGRIEAKLTAKQTVAEKPQPTRTATPPPTPPATLEGTGSAKVVTKKDVENDYLAWKRLRDAEVVESKRRR